MTRAVENWNRAYAEAPDVFDAFCRAEDPEGRLTRILLAHADLDGRTVLEIGCGTGRYTREWAPRAGRYLALERGPAVLALARRRCAGTTPAPELLLADARRVPLADRTVDRVLAGWVVINLPARARASVLQEAARVLRPAPGTGIWLVENHWSGEFQRLRGLRGDVERARVRALIDDHGFSPVEVVETEIRFPSPGEAGRVLGWLLGDAVRRELLDCPTDRLSHHVIILHRPSRT